MTQTTCAFGFGKKLPLTRYCTQAATNLLKQHGIDTSVQLPATSLSAHANRSIRTITLFNVRAYNKSHQLTVLFVLWIVKFISQDRDTACMHMQQLSTFKRIKASRTDLDGARLRELTYRPTCT